MSQRTFKLLGFSVGLWTVTVTYSFIVLNSTPSTSPSTMLPVPLPYFADPESLPRPIPTLDEIRSSEDVIYRTGGRKIVCVGPYVVKFGLQVELAEGENMLFVAHSASVPVPRVYALFKSAEGKEGYIAMERVTGNTLVCDVYHLLEATAVWATNLYWTIFSGTATSRRKLTVRSAQKRSLTKPWSKSTSSINGSQIKAEFYKRYFPSILQDHPPVFTWRLRTRKHYVTVSQRHGTRCRPCCPGVRVCRMVPQLLGVF